MKRYKLNPDELNLVKVNFKMAHISVDACIVADVLEDQYSSFASINNYLMYTDYTPGQLEELINQMCARNILDIFDLEWDDPNTEDMVYLLTMDFLASLPANEKII